MARDVTLRLPDETARRLENVAERMGRPVSELAAVMIEEWLRQEAFPDIEFRTFNGERHACVKGAMQIWLLVMTAQHWDLDVEKTATYFPIPAHRIRGAFDYYRAYPDEIDRALAENRAITFEDIKRDLPHTTQTIVHLDPVDDKSPVF
jgi:hypothetical protein